jgi:hypothetical protein
MRRLLGLRHDSCVPGLQSRSRVLQSLRRSCVETFIPLRLSAGLLQRRSVR